MKIELTDIKKSYNRPGGIQRRDVLNGISIAVRPGETLAVVGPSGSGKSTMLNIMGTLDRPTSGSVKYDDAEVSRMNDRQLAELRNRHVGFVFQMHHLLPQLSLIENVLLPQMALPGNEKRQEAADRAMALLDTVGLADKISQRPGQLSVGECQRTAVVRALINRPDILLADEPTGSLDQRSADQLGDLLVHINEKHGVSVVLVTHSMRLAGRMQKVLHLQNGLLTA